MIGEVAEVVLLDPMKKIGRSNTGQGNPVFDFKFKTFMPRQ
jgi:hypothetical protein